MSALSDVFKQTEANARRTRFTRVPFTLASDLPHDKSNTYFNEYTDPGWDKNK